MSKWMYISQAILIAGVLYVLVRRQPVVLRLQVIAWAIGVIGIWLRFGEEQLGFYSNDQIHYASIVRILVHEAWPRTPIWWLEFSKIPYPAAAVPLALMGIDSTLALKTVSLLFLLALSKELLQRYDSERWGGQARVLFLTGCGLIGSYFSVLALRETMMMFFVYQFAIKKNIALRISSLLFLLLLRSHLAAALLAADFALLIWRRLTSRLKPGYLEAPSLALIGMLIGSVLFSWRFAGLNRIQFPFTGDWGAEETIQVVSNFAGLQFLTVHEAFVRLSISELLLLRVVFSETVLIPLGFTVACFVLGPLSQEHHKFALLSFTTYVSIVINTDFNSFRQNIPLMPIMGLVLLDSYRRYRERGLRDDARPSITAESVVSR